MVVDEKMNNRQIAKSLGISRKKVDWIIANLVQRLGQKCGLLYFDEKKQVNK